MEELRNPLLKNNYPSQIIDIGLERFHKFKKLNVDKQSNPDEKIKYLSLPYINDKSEIISRKIQSTVKDNFQKNNLRFALKSPATLGSHFPLIDKVVDPKKLTCIVYQLKCKNCDASYVGKQLEFAKLE